MISIRELSRNTVIALGLTIPLLAGCGITDRPALSATQDEGNRTLGIEGQRNFRDIGGYQTASGETVKWSRIYRSGKLSDLTADDLNEMSNLDVDLIIDFRSESEREGEPTKYQEAEILELPIGGTAADWSTTLSAQLQSGQFTQNEIRQTFIEAYEQIPIDNAGEYRTFFDQILEQKDGTIVFHCTSGKDRTGIGTAFLLSALGVPRETIMEDYMLTNEVAGVDRGLPFIAKAFSQRAGRDIDPESLRPLVGVEEIYLETTFETIEASYGSMDAYLEQALGLTAAKRATLREKLLE